LDEMGFREGKKGDFGGVFWGAVQVKTSISDTSIIQLRSCGERRFFNSCSFSYFSSFNAFWKSSIISFEEREPAVALHPKKSVVVIISSESEKLLKDYQNLFPSIYPFRLKFYKIVDYFSSRRIFVQGPLRW
jgi:hypothetical protein